MIKSWLKNAEVESATYSFPVAYQEEGPVEREDLLKYLGGEVSSSLVDPEYLKQIAELAGLSAARQYLEEHVTTHSVRMLSLGCFCDVAQRQHYKLRLRLP